MLAYWMTWLRSQLNDEAGQGLVEYALIIVLVAIALIVFLVAMAGGIGNAFSRVTSALGLPAG